MLGDYYLIEIQGQPPRTTHQSGTRISGKHTYKTKALKEAELYLEESLKPHVPGEPIDGPIELVCTWGFEASNSRQNHCWKTTKPDTDNMQKTLKDVMTRMGFWKDDALVVHETCKKIWTDQPGIQIEIKEIDERCR